MIANSPKANSLHYKVTLAISNTMKGLKGIIPGAADSLGRETISFKSYEMKILESNPANVANHRIAICFTTPELYLQEVIDDFMVLSIIRKSESEEDTRPFAFTMQMQPMFGVTYYAVAAVPG